ncbi:DUF3616 domain-containing protein [Thiomicrorhabdus cannonii]|uniref:DUF3616 domain-containing protein n=1 Tax=Thiomicrorhabdus cannonii TaxID=2748011 RepID=UPI0015B8BE1D|nr:DUF3616 domain-containing protein [Thiomicrorhabdus cannonii]
MSILRIHAKPLLLVLSALTFSPSALQAGSPELLPIQGKLDIDNRNISGLVVTERFAVVATDEGNALQILKNHNGNYAVKKNGVVHLTDNSAELDLEGLAWQAPYLYAIGSHSRKRKKIDIDASDKDNLNRLSRIIHEPSRHQLFQIELMNNAEVKQIRATSLDKWIAQEPILAPFSALPSKENGIDIEGIAVDGEKLYVGFRGPVLRGNLTPILQFKLDSQTFSLAKQQLKLLNLGGLGIRDMAANQGKLWLLTGPVNETPYLFQLFSWQGQQALTPLPPAQTLKGDWLTDKPEAIAFDPQHPQQLWLAQDGAKNGAIRRLPLANK